VIVVYLVGAVDLIFSGEQPYAVKEAAGFLNANFRVNATASHDLTFVITMTNNFATGEHAHFSLIILELVFSQ